jgi:mono/diheme cytochrome c family protein
MVRSLNRTLLLTAVCFVVSIILVLTFVARRFGRQVIFGARIRPLSNIRFEATNSRVARGAYLVNAVARCPNCHSQLDWTLPGAPAKPEKFMAGRVWSEEGFPWITSPNLTPDPSSGAGNWSDDMLARAIREGIGHDGRALLPIMPYQSFHSMSDEDLASIIGYLRSLSPLRNALPKTQVPFYLGRRILVVPSPITTPIPPADNSSQILRGKYLVEMSACGSCHTVQTLEGKPIEGLAFAGGFVFQTPFGRLASANI